MDKIEKIRQEIKRRHDYENEMYHKKKPDGRPNDGWAESLAIMGVLEELLTFLDTLSEESDKSLEEAAEEYIKKGKYLPEAFVVRPAFIAGAKWMAKQKEQKPDIEICPHSIKSKSYKKKPAEWSEEDEEMYARVVRRYTDYEGVIMRTKEESVATKMLDAMAQEEIWLKFLRPQPHWEPSEEQMTELFHALIPGAEYDYDILEELYYGLRSWLDSIHNQQK